MRVGILQVIYNVTTYYFNNVINFRTIFALVNKMPDNQDVRRNVTDDMVMKR